MTDLTETFSGSRLDVTAGRVTAIDLGVPVVGIKSDPEGGNVTINPDGTVTLVLPDPASRGSTSFAALVEDDEGLREIEVPLRAVAGPQKGGWGAGDHYMLETDEDDRVVVEPGENHRKIYVSESDDALSRADIAAREGLGTGEITRKWLMEHSEYGSRPELALDTEAGMSLWYGETGGHVDASHWLLFERGYEYEGTGRLIDRGAEGESALHPMFIGAWGEGDRPVLEDNFSIFQSVSKNIVLQGIDFAEGGGALTGGNLLFDDLVLRDETSLQGFDQTIERATLRNSQILDATGDTITNGLYATNVDGLLIEGTLADHNAWEEGYETGDGQAPNKFSHNFYIQYDNLDVTFRDNVTMRGASFGAQIRSGGVVEGNAFLDNNIAFSVKGGSYRGGPYDGNYSLVLDNVVSSGAHKEAQNIGALAWGAENSGYLTSLIRNVITHLADPADPEERAEKTSPPKTPLNNIRDAFVDDTVIYNWVTDNWRGHRLYDSDQNVPDIAHELLDEVTLRRFLENVLGQRNPDDVIDELGTYLRAHWGEVGAADVVRFFQDGFGIETGTVSAPQSLRFVPDVRGDGMRWDNRLNWGPEELPEDGDSVDLAGNWVTYSGTTALDAVDLGEGGVLTVRQGRLSVEELKTDAGSEIVVGLAGQIWVEGYHGVETLAVTVEGGRFANTGRFEGPAEFAVSGGETILATAGARFELDGRLEVSGRGGKVGFDGQGGGTAAFALASGAVLGFETDGSGVSGIGEFRSGHWGTEAPDIRSALDLGAGDTTLALDLGALGGHTSLTLAEVDALTGGFGAVEITGRAAGTVTLTIDYAADRLELDVGRGGRTPLLDLVGSDAADVFVVAGGVQVTIDDYAGGDAIDLSAVLDGGDLAGLSLVATGQGAALVDGGGTRLVLFEGAAVDSVVVRAGGREVTVDGDGADGGSGQPQEPEEPENRAPVAEDGALSGAADAALSGRLSAEDADDDPLVYELAEGPETGRVTIGADGSFRYDPQGAFETLAEGEVRTVSFEYVVRDGEGGSDRGSVSLTLQGQYAPEPAPEPEPQPEPEPEPQWNRIDGSDGFDVIEATDGADLIRSGGGGYDRIWGGEGADAFVFGAEAGDGVRTNDQVFDFDAAEDMLVLEEGVQIASMQNQGDMLWITLEGDSDLIILNGSGLTPEAIEVVQTGDVWLG